MAKRKSKKDPGVAQALEKLARLASFPDENPNPVIEIDCLGRVTYLNPAAHKKFPDLGERGARHPLLEGLMAVVERVCSEETESAVHEVRHNDVVYEAEISFNPGCHRTRIYMTDITALCELYARLEKREEL